VYFIKRSKYIQHLDFTGCNLFEKELKEIVKACKKSGSVQAVHLCLNPGLNSQDPEKNNGLIEYLRKFLHCDTKENEEFLLEQDEKKQLK